MLHATCAAQWFRAQFARRQEPSCPVCRLPMRKHPSPVDTTMWEEEQHSLELTVAPGGWDSTSPPEDRYPAAASGASQPQRDRRGGKPKRMCCLLTSFILFLLGAAFVSFLGKH